MLQINVLAFRVCCDLFLSKSFCNILELFAFSMLLGQMNLPVA